MNTNSLASLVTIPNLKTIKVKFHDSTKLYTYKTLEKDISTDDYVVVNVRNILVKLARVVEVDKVPNLSKDVNYKWIVQKVDFSEHNRLNEMEANTADALRELEQKALVSNATNALADRLNVNVEQIQDTIKTVKSLDDD